MRKRHILVEVVFQLVLGTFSVLEPHHDQIEVWREQKRPEEGEMFWELQKRHAVETDSE